MLFLLLCVLVVSAKGRYEFEFGSDYFSEDFDDDKNCQDKDLVKKLDKEGKCASTSKGEILILYNDETLSIMSRLRSFIRKVLIHNSGKHAKQNYQKYL